jgi:hypothetical protein
MVKCYIMGDLTCGEVSELADEHDLGSCAERRRGSSPRFPSFPFTSSPLIHRLNVKQKGDYIAVLDRVTLAFQSEDTSLTSLS